MKILKNWNRVNHFVYLLLCSDNTLYCGYTNDVDKRLHAHNNTSKGAKYTRNRRPVTLVYKEGFDDKSSALKREYQIKKLSRKEKLRLIENTKIVEPH